jgi:ribosomal subunit interface protein
MNLQITGTNVDVTDAIKDYIKKKLKKITKYLRDIIEIHVTVKQERYQQEKATPRICTCRWTWRLSASRSSSGGTGAS